MGPSDLGKDKFGKIVREASIITHTTPENPRKPTSVKVNYFQNKK